MEFGTSRKIKPKVKYVRISLKEIWRNLDGPPYSNCVYTRDRLSTKLESFNEFGPRSGQS